MADLILQNKVLSAKRADFIAAILRARPIEPDFVQPDPEMDPVKAWGQELSRRHWMELYEIGKEGLARDGATIDNEVIA